MDNAPNNFFLLDQSHEGHMVLKIVLAVLYLRKRSFTYFFNLFIFNWRIIFYNIMLVSAIYQHKLAMGIHIYFLIEGQLLYNPVWFLS